MQPNKPVFTTKEFKFYSPNLFFWLLLFLLMVLSFTYFSVQTQAAPETNKILKLSSEIKGHQAQPKVLFILPWQTPQNETPDTIQAPQLIPQYLLAPIDRAEFNQQSHLIEALQNKQHN